MVQGESPPTVKVSCHDGIVSPIKGLGLRNASAGRNNPLNLAQLQHQLFAELGPPIALIVALEESENRCRPRSDHPVGCIASAESIQGGAILLDFGNHDRRISVTICLKQ
jgi:hypothetical protein